ncbi:PAS domain S-box-containing protein [Rhodoblastus acidophilus]|uniref:sensor histidine kinase n=1 Tax=Rhodoblastus acidophilus TaxID=1074 RepID=UPI0022250B92|nr:PAS domain S-box protein [Rhodoblastus acidophilus]MCW2283218.1 PAS domain S-box-containing protein [Rhodoblastus acidophilus]MCW2332078.1 PAS domain S-box-containing protein [Rhodoblastus acidophilus]
MIHSGQIEADLFELAPCGLAVVAPNGQILRANQLLREWIGFRGGAPEGQNLSSMLVGDGSSFFASLIDSLRQDEPAEEVFALLQRGNGAILPVYLNAVLRRGASGVGRGAETVHISFISAWRRTEYEAELRRGKRAAEQLASIVSHSSDAIVSVDRGGRILNANFAFSDIFQFDRAEVLGAKLSELIVPEQYREQFEKKLRRAAHRPIKGEIVRRRRKDGIFLDFSLSLAPIRDESTGETVAISAIYRDVTALTRAAEHIEFLLREVNHRSKNMLAVVQAVARQTARFADSPEAFTDGFMARLAAIGASHDMLVSRDWRGVQVEELTRIQCCELIESEESRIVVSGDLIEINPRAAESYGLALHELATNAVKYGALSTTEGWVELTFALDPETQTYRFSWREQGGPPVEPPERNGFGVCVLTRTAPQSINGESRLDFPQEGLTYTLSAPLAQVAMSGLD